MIVSAIVAVALYVANRDSRNDEPRTANLEPNSEHEPGSENREG